MDKLLWDVTLKKASNNLTYLLENENTTEVWVAGQTKAFEGDISEYSREQTYPKDGWKLYHRSTYYSV